jgi:hypothetical protein
MGNRCGTTRRTVPIINNARINFKILVYKFPITIPKQTKKQDRENNKNQELQTVPLGIKKLVLNEGFHLIFLVCELIDRELEKGF